MLRNVKSFIRIRALVKKEFFQIMGDFSSILIAIIFPVVLLFIYGVGVSLDMTDVKVGFVMEETSSDVQSFMLSLKNSTYFSVDISRTHKELEDKLTAGKLKGIVVVPFYFSQFEKRPAKESPIYVIADGSEPNSASFVQNYVQGAWAKWLQQKTIAAGGKRLPVIEVQPRFWFNEELNSRHFLIPGSIAIIMTLIGSLLTALVISREWERGTIEALMATPVTMKEIYTAKLIAYFFLGMGSMLICTLLSIFAFGVPFRGSIGALFLMSSFYLLTALGTGLLISSIARNQFMASQISIITAFLPAFMLSGFVFEISSMPWMIRLLTYLIPARYMVQSLQTLFLVGDVWELLLFNLGVMVLVICILFAIIFAKTRKRLD